MERAGPWSRLAAVPLRLWVLFVYVLLVAAPNNAYLPDAVRLALVNGRPFALAAILAYLVVDALRDPAAVRGYVRRSGYVGLALIAGLFPVYYLIIAGLKGEVRWPTAALYGLWVAAAFVAWPLAIRDRQQIGAWIRLFFAAVMIGWLVPTAYGAVAGEPADRVFTHVRSFGYLNPDYFGQLIEVAFACALVLAPRRRSLKIARLAVLIAAPLAIATLSARNVMVFIAVLLVVRPLLGAARRPGPVVGGVLLVSALLALTLSQYIERTRVDTFASGRLSAWSDRLEESFAKGDDAVTFAIGPVKLPRQRRSGYDPLGESKRFAKFHTDNAYLELFFEAGALGLLLFVWPYLLAAIGGLRRIQRTRDELTIWAIAVLVAIACQSMFTSSVPSFANPVAFLFLTTLGVLLGPVRR